MSPSTTTFVSYSHDTPEHVNRVIDLATRLREDGIDVELDQWVEAPPEGWSQWMERQTRTAQYVLVVCTETYLRRSRDEENPGRGRGVRFESLLTTQHLYDADSKNHRFIPVLFRSDDEAHIPTPLRSTTYYNVSDDAGYQKLYRRLTNQPQRVKPPLGAIKQMPPVGPTKAGPTTAEPTTPATTPTTTPEPTAPRTNTAAGYTVGSLRAFLMQVLVTDSDLEAFCIDHFLDTKRLLTNGMDRVAKTNLLIEREDPQAILTALKESQASRYSRFEHLLKKADATPRTDGSRDAAAAGVATAAATASVPGRVQIYNALCRMLPAEFNQVVFLLAVPSGFIQGGSTPQATRASELVTMFEREGDSGLERLAQTIRSTTPRLL